MNCGYHNSLFSLVVCMPRFKPTTSVSLQPPLCPRHSSPRWPPGTFHNLMTDSAQNRYSRTLERLLMYQATNSFSGLNRYTCFSVVGSEIWCREKERGEVFILAYGFLYTTLTAAALSFPPTRVPHNSTVNITTLCNVGFSFISLPEKWKLARCNFIFMRSKWNTLVQEDAAELRGCHVYDPTATKKKGGNLWMNIVASTDGSMHKIRVQTVR